jgi:hypothetical protein
VTAPTDYDAKAAENVTKARAGLAKLNEATREGNGFLCDVAMFDPQVKTGALIASGGRLDLALSLGGLRTAGFDGMPVDEIREALRAYGEWIKQVADLAL